MAVRGYLEGGRRGRVSGSVRRDGGGGGGGVALTHLLAFQPPHLRAACSLRLLFERAFLLGAPFWTF